MLFVRVECLKLRPGEGESGRMGQRSTRTSAGHSSLAKIILRDYYERVETWICADQAPAFLNQLDWTLGNAVWESPPRLRFLSDSCKISCTPACNKKSSFLHAKAPPGESRARSDQCPRCRIPGNSLLIRWIERGFLAGEDALPTSRYCILYLLWLRPSPAELLLQEIRALNFT